MIFKIKALWKEFLKFPSSYILALIWLAFSMGCGLKTGEAPPPPPIYYFQALPDEARCSAINYKQRIKDYFFNLNQPGGGLLAEALTCLSLQIRKISSLIYNETLNREELLAVLEDGFIDLQNFEEPLKKVLAPELSRKFSLYKNYVLQLTDPESDLDASALCALSDQDYEDALAQDTENFTLSVDKNVLLYQSDIDLILNFLDTFQKSLSMIEEEAQSILLALQKHSAAMAQEAYQEESKLDAQNSIEGGLASNGGEESGWNLNQSEKFKMKPGEPQIYKRALFFSEEKFIYFIDLLEQSLANSFPSYSIFLREEREHFRPADIDEAYSIRHNSFYVLQKELYPLYESLYVFSDEEPLHLLDMKYFLMMLHFMKALFQNYDQNKNGVIDDQELNFLSCAIEPFLSVLIKEELKDSMDWVQNYYSTHKIIRYIFKHQEIPGPFSVQYFRFDPDREITLSFKEAFRLVQLFFRLGLDEAKSLL